MAAAAVAAFTKPDVANYLRIRPRPGKFYMISFLLFEMRQVLYVELLSSSCQTETETEAAFSSAGVANTLRTF